VRCGVNRRSPASPTRKGFRATTRRFTVCFPVRVPLYSACLAGGLSTRAFVAPSPGIGLRRCAAAKSPMSAETLSTSLQRLHMSVKTVLIDAERNEVAPTLRNRGWIKSTFCLNRGFQRSVILLRCSVRHVRFANRH
jgi:hypothetical protein